jgi:hypothetical protein
MAKSSFVERNRAVREAWSKEQELVQERKGTREWTREQQKDILEKGRAYDDNGKAFEGQHMKSAEKYPEYQGEPGNIQFLTRAEHLEAHDGNWQNPTNWYFNPITKEKIDFGNGPFIPCEIIRLPEPIITITDNETSLQEQAVEEKKQPDKITDTPNQSVEKEAKVYSEPKAPNLSKVQVPKKSSNRFVKGLKSVGRFIVDHPVESLEIAGVVIGGAAKAISSIRGSGSSSSSGRISQPSSSSSNTSSIADKVVNIVEKANRALPGENDVSGHRQRYHTKNGVIWKDKAPYHRGSNKD